MVDSANVEQIFHVFIVAIGELDKDALPIGTARFRHWTKDELFRLVYNQPLGNILVDHLRFWMALFQVVTNFMVTKGSQSDLGVKSYKSMLICISSTSFHISSFYISFRISSRRENVSERTQAQAVTLKIVFDIGLLTFNV